MIVRHTFAQLLHQGGAQLRNCSPSPALDTRVLLQWAARASEVRLITDANATPGALALARFRYALRRRKNGESVAAITRRKEFFGLSLRLSRAVLAPRPETELLVERALALLDPGRSYRIADLGTGSGAIAIAIAGARPQCRVFATDSERRALAVARANAARHNVDRIRFRCGSWFTALNETRFDMILGNPPYVADGDPRLNDDGLRHEPRVALGGGADGLDALREIIRGAPAHLGNGGMVLLEHGATQGAAVRALFAASGFSAIRTHRDLGGHERLGEAVFTNDHNKHNKHEARI